MFQKNQKQKKPKAPVKAEEIEEFAEEGYELPDERAPKKKELPTEAPVVEEPQAPEQSEDEEEEEDEELTEERVKEHLRNIYKFLENQTIVSQNQEIRLRRIEHNLRLDFNEF